MTESTLEIVMVYAYDPACPGMGGGVRYVHNLLLGFSAKGILVTLLGVRRTEIVNEIPCVRFIPLGRGDQAWWTYFLTLFVASFYSLPKEAVIHTHRSYYMLPFILFRRTNRRVCTLHMKPLEFVKIEYPKSYRLVAPFYYLIEQFCLRNVHAIVAINDEVKRSYESRYPCLKGMIRVVEGTNVNTELFRPLSADRRNDIRRKLGIEPSSKVILFVGRIEKIKNPGFLVRSFSILSKEKMEYVLLVAGRGSEEMSLKTLVTSLGIEDKTIFLGEITSDKELVEIYNSADALALCSLSESSPTVVREALACGVPVASLNLGDISRLTNDGRLITVVSPPEEETFAAALASVTQRAFDHRQETAVLARSVALAKFDSSISVEKYLEIYRDAPTVKPGPKSN